MPAHTAQRPITLLPLVGERRVIGTHGGDGTRPSVEVYSPECIGELRNKVRRQAERSRVELNQLDTGGMETLFAFKFGNLGYPPVQEGCLDFIEQLNQIFTVMV